MSKADRKLLKRHGLGREYKEMGAPACAPESAKAAPRVPGYAEAADLAHGVRTRQRVRRERRRRRWRAVRRVLWEGLPWVLPVGGLPALGVWVFFRLK